MVPLLRSLLVGRKSLCYYTKPLIPNHTILYNVYNGNFISKSNIRWKVSCHMSIFASHKKNQWCFKGWQNGEYWVASRATNGRLGFVGNWKSVVEDKQVVVRCWYYEHLHTFHSTDLGMVSNFLNLLSQLLTSFFSFILNFQCVLLSYWFWKFCQLLSWQCVILNKQVKYVEMLWPFFQNFQGTIFICQLMLNLTLVRPSTWPR